MAFSDLYLTLLLRSGFGFGLGLFHLRNDKGYTTFAASDSLAADIIRYAKDGTTGQFWTQYGNSHAAPLVVYRTRILTSA